MSTCKLPTIQTFTKIMCDSTAMTGIIRFSRGYSHHKKERNRHRDCFNTQKASDSGVIEMGLLVPTMKMTIQ
jgi:hypothetical protein